MSLFSGEFPPLRPFQATTHEAIRQAAREGHKRILVCAPTGAGKTVQAMNTIKETLGKGRRAMFLADRKTLIAQTSNVARDLGLGRHGIIQADNPMLDLSLPFQIASCQTLMRRGWPDSDVLIIDEVHTMYKTWRDRILDPECRSFVIGLTATPFSPGLGRYFTKLINAATMAELTESGTLVPMRIFSCRRPDMSDAGAKPGGEWSDEAAAKAEMAIIGDVLTEWQRIASDRKTIIFGPTVAYSNELAKRFNDAGITAAVFCNETPDDERARLTTDFAHGFIRVLISVDALAKGFDQKDVGCVCDCRPLRKSLSTAIQMWGRGLRSSPETGKADCIARGSKVLTDRGQVLIQDVRLTDKIWDGYAFVAHRGAVCKGIKNVITYAGLTATPDHLVKTKEGWRPFGECAREQVPIVTTGSGGAAIRESENRFTSCLLAGAEAPDAYACFGGMPRVRVPELHPVLIPFQRCIQWMQGMWPASEGPNVVTCSLREHGAEMPEPQRPALGGVWWAWNRISIRWAHCLRSVDHRKSWPSGQCQGPGAGSDQQRRALRAWEHPVGQPEVEHGQSEGFSSHRQNASVHAGTSRGSVRRIYVALSDWFRNAIRRDCRSVQRPFVQAQREVWDILDCGPRNSFTCENLLVHNCKLLDFSGNVIRFWDDFETFFHNGVDHLDEGEKLDKKVREDKDEAPRACPKCGHTPFGRKCVQCGFEVVPKDIHQELPGHMQEIRIGKKVLARDKADLWAQVATYARDHARPGKDPAKKALAIYRDVTGEWPPRGWTIYNAPDVPPSPALLGKIRSRNIAYAKGRAAA